MMQWRSWVYLKALKIKEKRNDSNDKIYIIKINEYPIGSSRKTWKVIVDGEEKMIMKGDSIVVEEVKES